MADDNSMDISQHRALYSRFLEWAKWGTVVAFVLAAIVMVIIA